MPKVGKKVELPEGKGKVVRQNVMARSFTVQLEDGREIDIDLEKGCCCRGECGGADAESPDETPREGRRKEDK
jgi:hypothetical protein